MLESYINAGNQKFPGWEYGISITDECLCWEDIEEIVLNAYDKL